MKGREAKAGPSPDLLACFPSRAHLNLSPKLISSPGRDSESNRRPHHLRKSGTRSGAQPTPLLWANPKSVTSEIAEPTSPKVTCAGKIKVSQNTAAWQSVMEEIEKTPGGKKLRKPSHSAESLGFKREIMQFLTCLRSITFDLRCFGSFPDTNITTEDDDREEEGEEEEEQYEGGGYRENHGLIEESDGDASGVVFSEWFMMLQENQNNGFREEDPKVEDDGGEDGSIAVPPPNALLLMRCRSAPTKSWFRENEEREKEDSAHTEDDKEEVDRTNERSLKLVVEKENLVVTRYDSDFYKMSLDIAKETWIVDDDGLRDPLFKSRSWRR